MSMSALESLTAITFHYDWAVMLYQNGELERSMHEVLEVTAQRKERYGMSNSLTLQSYVTLGILLFHKRNYCHARYYIGLALVLSRNTDLAAENFAHAKHYLSFVLSAKSNEEDEDNEAKTLAREADHFLGSIPETDRFPKSFLSQA